MAASSFFRRGARLLKCITKESQGFDKVGEKLELTAFTEGQCTCRMVVGKEHENIGGSLHGGFTATLVDLVTTMSIMSTGMGQPGVSVGMNVSYLKGTQSGDEIIIDAKCVKAGRTLAFSTADVRLADGTLLALGQHTKYLGTVAPVKFSDIKES